MSQSRIIVMGPSGVGKTHTGTLLATELGLPFIDADDLHTPEAIERMRAGTPLTDEDRLPWLERVGTALANQPCVIACSALTRNYRDILRSHATDVFFAELDAPADVIEARLEWREGHFMPASLLQSQLATLEHLAPDENGVRVDATWRDDEIVELIVAMATPASGE